MSATRRRTTSCTRLSTRPRGSSSARRWPSLCTTPRARQDFNDLPAEVIANRATLREAMTRHGFDPLPSEWWHFDYHGWERFELLDIPFTALRTASPPKSTPP